MSILTMIQPVSPAVPPLADDLISVCDALLDEQAHHRKLLSILIGALDAGCSLADLEVEEIGMLQHTIPADDFMLQDVLAHARLRSVTRSPVQPCMWAV